MYIVMVTVLIKGNLCRMDDKLIEVVGMYSSLHIGTIQVSLSEPLRIGQASEVKVILFVLIMRSLHQYYHDDHHYNNLDHQYDHHIILIISMIIMNVMIQTVHEKFLVSRTQLSTSVFIIDIIT